MGKRCVDCCGNCFYWWKKEKLGWCTCIASDNINKLTEPGTTCDKFLERKVEKKDDKV